MDRYYKGNKEFKVGKSFYQTYICCGQRGRGKTTVHLTDSVDWYMFNYFTKHEPLHRFHLLRRTDEQLKQIISKGIFNACLSVPEYREKFNGYICEEIRNGEILLINPETQDKLPVGYLESLNNVKGKAVEDSDNLIFDEYVEPDRSLYKGGDGGLHEPELLGRLDDTLFRGRERWICILGNEDAPTNPYNEYFKIPYGIENYHDKPRKLLYHFDYSEEYEKYKETTAVGTLWKGTTYGDYSIGKKALGEVNNAIIKDKPAHATHVYNIDCGGTKLTLWHDKQNDLYYLHDNCKFDETKPVYTVFSTDMTVNSLFVSYQTNFLLRMKLLYSCAMIRFNSQKSANMFALVVSLTR